MEKSFKKPMILFCLAGCVLQSGSLMRAEGEKLPVQTMIDGVSQHFSKNQKIMVLSGMLASMSPWLFYKLHYSKLKTDQVTKYKPKNAKEKAQYFIYRAMSYLAYQDENGTWCGPLPVVDNKVGELREVLKKLKERLDVINVVGTLSYMIVTGKVSFELYKFLIDGIK